MDARGLEYQAAVGSCALVGSMLTQYDLPAMLNAIERAEAIGPMIDPTLYREKAEAMGQDKDLLEAALPLWRWAMNQKRIAESKVKTEARLS
jgi:hypothetical protein